MSTDKRLIAAATALLDSGGEDAVTVRAVAQASGVSHNAPYKHFENRDALLAAVAMADFTRIGKAFKDVRESRGGSAKKLMKGLHVMIDFSHKHPARYGLLFSNPSIAAATGELKQIAGGAFYEFVGIVEECQAAGELPNAPGTSVASLLFATMHGLIAIESNGGMHAEKGPEWCREQFEIIDRTDCSKFGQAFRQIGRFDQIGSRTNAITSRIESTISYRKLASTRFVPMCRPVFTNPTAMMLEWRQQARRTH